VFHVTTLSIAKIIQGRRWTNKGTWSICGITLTKDKRSTRKNPVPVPRYPPQISSALARGGTRLCAVRSL